MYSMWKRASANYAFKYGGIGKRARLNPAAVASRILRDANTYSGKSGKRRPNYALKYGGIGKRSTDHIEHSELHEEQQHRDENIPKSRSKRSPKLAMKYGGIGKRTSDFAGADSAEMMDKRSPKFAMKYGGIGKRTRDYVEPDADEIMDKRSPKLAMKYGGIGKRSIDESDAVQIMDKRSAKIAMKYGGIGKRTSNFPIHEDDANMDKRSAKLAMKYGGIGKRTKEFSSADHPLLSVTDKRALKVAMKYAGIGKRSVPDSVNEFANTNANESEAATARLAQNIHNIKSDLETSKDDDILIKQRLQAMVKDMEQQYYSQASEKFITVAVSPKNATSTKVENGGKRLKRQVEDDYFTQSLGDFDSDESANIHNVLEALRRYLLSNTAVSSSDRLHSELYPRAHYYSKRKSSSDPLVRNHKYFGIGR